MMAQDRTWRTQMRNKTNCWEELILRTRTKTAIRKEEATSTR